MRKYQRLVKRAQSLSSNELKSFLVQTIDHYFEIYDAINLTENYKEQIVNLFETNMKIFYQQSNDGYDPTEKRNELFSSQSRYIIIFSDDIISAFAHFRFDMDYGQCVLYLYELQVKNQCQGKGLGKWIIEQLKIIGQKTDMLKIVLTVHKANVKAIEFYMKKCQFTADISNPDDDEHVDYLILSLNVK